MISNGGEVQHLDSTNHNGIVYSRQGIIEYAVIYGEIAKNVNFLLIPLGKSWLFTQNISVVFNKSKV